MKRKLLIICAIVGGGSFASAQTTMVKNDKGQVVTPEAGDWALGADASPILNYLGNMFNGTTGNSLDNAFTNTNNAIFGKYFVDENTAYRGSLRISTVSNSVSVLSDTNTLVDTNPEYISDITKTNGFSFYLSGGIEKRRGHGRLQGFYGGELGFGFGAAAPNTSNEFEVALSATNPGPIGGRILSTKAGSSFTVGLRGFVGVEYFVLPKLSFGAEFGWGLLFRSTAQNETVTESWNGTQIIETTSSTTGKSSSFFLNTDKGAGTNTPLAVMPAGSFRIMYHF
jgi:hypothetical protein